MSFNKQAVRELRRRADLTQENLAELLISYAQRKGLERRTDQYFISKLESETSSIKPSIDTIDLFYLIARNKGYADLNFYIPPTADKD